MEALAIDGRSPRHLVVVGGSLREWRKLDDAAWRYRLGELGKVADHAGVRWLVLRPFGDARQTLEAAAASPEPAPEILRTTTVGSCLVFAQSVGDGRARFVQAAAALHEAGEQITEAAIDAALNAPADADPDLVVIVGSQHRSPPSLVWQLAYSELVYADGGWEQFGAGQLDEAIKSYASRHRRFGGID